MVHVDLLLIKPLHAELRVLYRELAEKNLLKLADSFNDFLAGILSTSVQVARDMKRKAEAESRLVRLPSEL